jgi:hypothetical protein
MLAVTLIPTLNWAEALVNDKNKMLQINMMKNLIFFIVSF